MSLGGIVLSTRSARVSARRHSRLLAACTAGALSFGVLVLSPAAVARADTTAPANSTAAPHHATGRLAPRATAAAARPTLHLPRGVRHSSTAADGTALTTPRFDMDGDGSADILTQEADGTFQVLPSTTNQWTSLGTGPAKFLDVLTPGDVDPGLSGPEVLTLTTTGELSLWNYSALPSGSPVWVGEGWQIYDKVVAVGDITGDGNPDLLARTPTGDLYLYQGTGNGSAPFTARVKVGYGFGTYDQLIGAGDLTGSGGETLVARDLAGDLWLYTATGDPAAPLGARVKIGYGWNTYNQIIGLGDEPDVHGGILGRTVPGQLYYYTGQGTAGGQLTARSFVGDYWNDQLIAGQGSNPFWGRNNLFGLSSGGTLYYYAGTDAGGLTARLQVGDAGGWKGSKLYSSVSFTDQDEEPLLEVYKGQLWNDATGNLITGGWTYGLTLGPGDLNGDGRSDLLARDSSGILWSFPGRGDGTFGSRVKLGGGWNAYNSVVGAGDIDGNGHADIVARASNGHLYFYEGTGIATAPFKSRVDLGGGWNTYTKLAAPGDLDGDGRADIVGVTSSGQLYRYSGSGHSGTSTFKSRAEIGTSGWNGYSSVL
jgi:FG-GAP-like repeat